MSTATVARVLDDTAAVSPHLKRRVIGAVEELGYVRNAVAKSLATGRTGLLGVLVRDITNPFYSQVARGIEDAVSADGYLALVCSSDFDARKERLIISRFRSRLVDGVALAVGSGDEALLEDVVKSGVPVTLFDQTLHRGSHSHLSAVLVDNVDAGARAAMHLISLGHTRLTVLSGGGGGTTSVARRSGFMDACRSAGVEAISVEGSELAGASGGVAAMQEAMSLSPRPTGVFSYNNVFTVGAIQAARELGIRIPEDVSLIGFDDMDLFSVMDPPLTVLSQPGYRMGLEVGALLLRRIAGDSTDIPDRVLKAELVLRASTAAPAREVAHTVADSGEH